MHSATLFEGGGGGWGGGGHCNIDDYRDMVQASMRRYRDWGFGGHNRLVLVYQNK